MARVIILGGIGFIGRHLVTYLCDNNLVSKVVISDKVLPEVAGLSPHEADVIASDKVIYKQANLARASSVESLYELDGGNWDYVVNLCAATKYSQAVEVYQENTVLVASINAQVAKKHDIKLFVHISTAQIYDSGKKPSDEQSKIKPWTSLAKACLQAESEVVKSGIKHIILRPAIVYGTGDATSITPRLICGAVYAKLGQTMEMLWESSLRLSTVHVKDVAAAIWFVIKNTTIQSGTIFNLADTNNTDQGSVAKLITELFGIKVSFMGSVKSSVITSIAIKTVADVANERHLKPWSDLLKQKGIPDSPLTPYLDEELLYNNSLSINGSEITKFGFSYLIPNMTVDKLKEVIVDFENKKFFPQGLLKV